MNNGVRSMLAEKFILVLETLIKGEGYEVQIYSDGSPRVVSSSPHVPIAQISAAHFAAGRTSRLARSELNRSNHSDFI
jgi:hypothetical protein